MITRTLLILSLSVVLLNAGPMVDYYNAALSTLGTRHLQSLESKRGSLLVDAGENDRLVSITFDAFYARTSADRLKDPFNITDISLSDTIDVFGKQCDGIEALRLETLGNKHLIDVQKQSLFTILTDMVTLYRKSEALHTLHERFYQQQHKILDDLQKGVQSGTFARMDASRFANALVILKVKTIKEKETLSTMQRQLDLYVPASAIPVPSDDALDADELRFIAHEPQLKYADLHRKALVARASGIAKGWRPDLVLGGSYRLDDDPTSYGDDYTLDAGLHIGFGGGIDKQAEGARVASLQADVENIQQRIEATKRYVALKTAYDSAQEILIALSSAQQDVQENADTMQKAYLRHYVDFNTYLQTMQQLLSIKEQAIEAKYQKIRSVLILNAQSQGTIYED